MLQGGGPLQSEWDPGEGRGSVIHVYFQRWEGSKLFLKDLDTESSLLWCSKCCGWNLRKLSFYLHRNSALGSLRWQWTANWIYAECKAILALLIETNGKKNTFCIICGRTGHLVSYHKRTYHKRKDMRCLIPRLVQKPTTLTALRDSTPPAPIVAGVPFAQVVREYTNGGMNTLHVRKHETEIMCNQQKTNLQNTYSEHSMPGQGPRPQWCYWTVFGSPRLMLISL